ncbi:MAG: AAA family ATPase [Deltaproteobacteria bacterium]|nr:AAA family ATPase [Deltaproteobacteria bacterium]
MKFSEVVEQVVTWLQRQRRVSYRALKREFDLDDDYLADLKEELIEARRVAQDEGGKILVWTGVASVASDQLLAASSSQSSIPQTSDSGLRTPDSQLQTLTPGNEGERRQLTVMFCDLVGSTALSERLDPEELRKVVRAYQQASAEVIDRFEGHIAQYLGDGLLVYFGYPVAHEDDAQRAVRAGLGIITALQHPLHTGHEVPSPLVGEGQGEGAKVRNAAPLKVRIGMHTGVVVVGEMGGGGKHEQLALGETPNIAARLQGLAEPDTVVLSAATQRLVAGLFECQDLGPQTLKGISTPLAVYRVVRESEAQSRFEAAVSKGLTPLVGRDEELGLLRRRWEQAKAGEGQVVLLSGEPGIGKSRLVQALKEYVSTEGATRIEFHCSAYHQNSAFHPIIEHLQRLLQFAPHATPHAKLAKLQQTLAQYRFPQADTLPLLAALLSLPQPEGTPPLTLSPQKQKQKTQEALVAWIVEEAERAAVYSAWEDLHWADPSTLEVLTLVLTQVPTARLLTLLTFRPDFTPPWRPHSHIAQLTLSRLGRPHVEAMVEQVTGGKALPPEVVQQIVHKTDGVPLFVEELTKMVVESGLLREEDGRYVGTHSGTLIPPLAIPSTLQDSLMARLDRLAPIREIAQVGAVLGREFSYDLLHAVSRLDEALLQQGLRQLVEAELIYQHGLPPQATYLFKHALIQDTAYQSLLKSRRQQLHQQIAQVLVEQFAETVETQPELLAHHYTEAGLKEEALPYWQQAGVRAAERSANIEAASHIKEGLALLQILPTSAEHLQQELTLQILLGQVLMATKGYGAPEVAAIQVRVQELCQQVGETPQLFQALPQLRGFYFVRGELHTARTLAEQYLEFAQRFQVPILLVWASYGLGETLLFSGEIASARTHLEQGTAAYDPQQVRAFFVRTVQDPGVACLSQTATALWYLGYPDQASERIRQALTLAQELSHPFSVAWALCNIATQHQLHREESLVQEQAEAAIRFAQEQGFPFWVARAETFRGWALTQRRPDTEGIAQIHQGMAAYQAMGMELYRPQSLALLAEAYAQVGQEEEGLKVLTEALKVIDQTGAHLFEAEVYRLKGALTLQSQTRLKHVSDKSQTSQEKSRVGTAHQNVNITEAGMVGDAHPTKEAEECFWKAIEIARNQQAKSLELRAVMGLSRLWQQQGKQAQARQMLAETYGWFTEGFDTKDLQEAKALLEELD